MPLGHRVVYVAESLALASLEVFVHLESDAVPLVSLRAFLPAGFQLEEVNPDALTPVWREEAAYPQLQKFGKEWHRTKRTPALKVPSAIIPVEYNYILNPEHPDFSYTADPPEEFQYDRRMWKRIEPPEANRPFART